MTGVIAFDTETHLIEAGLMAPPLVCFQWMGTVERVPRLYHRDSREPNLGNLIHGMLLSDHLLVGHNTAFDMAVIAAQWPDLIPAIFDKYDRDQVTDTMHREQLLHIARGTFKGFHDADGEFHKTKYSLADCVLRHLSRDLKKEGFRLFYRLFDDEPETMMWAQCADKFQAYGRQGIWPDWVTDYLERGILQPKHLAEVLAAAPEEAVAYALADASTTLELYEAQERVVLQKPGVLADQFRKARSFFALHLSSCHGLHVDPESIERLEKVLQDEFDAITRDLQEAGIIRDDGSANVAAAREAMVQACEDDDLIIPRTKGGAVSLGADACESFDEDSLIGKYSRFQTLRKTLANDIKMLRSGAEVCIQPRYGMADTGRTTCSKPGPPCVGGNIQAVNRGAGIRECVTPRPGYVFAQADFEGLELNTMSAWCLEKIGWSKMADDINAGIDVHAALAAEMMGILYEEGIARKKAGDKEFKEYRQRAKAINFGRPGGLGDKKFVAYARSQFGATVTLEEAAESKKTWIRKYPEFEEFFRIAAIATNNPNKEAEDVHLFTGRIRGKQRYSALCNGRFQGLGADAATEALWRVTRACYARPESPLYGSRVVAFVHDEIIAEVPDDHRAAPAAEELSRLMCEGANTYLSRVPVKAPLVLMRVWSKSAEAVYDAEGCLVPWAPEPN